MYSHDLQTCDWPRNVACQSVVSEPKKESSETEAETNVIVTDSKKVCTQNDHCEILCVLKYCVLGCQDLQQPSAKEAEQSQQLQTEQFPEPSSQVNL